jgi:ribonuclease P protein component
MFSKSFLLNKKEFEEVFKKGRAISNDFLLCKVLKGENLGVAVSVSKKVAKSAVKRHFIKRKILRVLRDNQATLKANQMVFILRKDISNVDNDQLRGIILDIVNKIV